MFDKNKIEQSVFQNNNFSRGWTVRETGGLTPSPQSSEAKLGVAQANWAANGMLLFLLPGFDRIINNNSGDKLSFPHWWAIIKSIHFLNSLIICGVDGKLWKAWCEPGASLSTRAASNH